MLFGMVTMEIVKKQQQQIIDILTKDQENYLKGWE